MHIIYQQTNLVGILKICDLTFKVVEKKLETNRVRNYCKLLSFIKVNVGVKG